mgnify:FL=1
MQAMRMMSKKEISELIDREFGDFDENTPIASFFTCSGNRERAEQQCLMFHKELKSWED